MSDEPIFFNECVNSALREIEATLAEDRFFPTTDEAWREGMKNRSFVRVDCPWKVDQVDVIFPASLKKSENVYFEIVFRVLLKDLAGETAKLDGVGMSFLTGKDGQKYEIPNGGIFKDRAQKRFAETIASDIRKSLPWFEEFNSIEKCLVRLKEEKTNLGAVKEKGAARTALTILEMWKSEPTQ